LPTGVCGETDEAGNVDSEYVGSGVSDVVGKGRGMLLRGLGYGPGLVKVCKDLAGCEVAVGGQPNLAKLRGRSAKGRITANDLSKGIKCLFVAQKRANEKLMELEARKGVVGGPGVGTLAHPECTW
jgi:hypothetical protein